MEEQHEYSGGSDTKVSGVTVLGFFQAQIMTAVTTVRDGGQLLVLHGHQDLLLEPLRILGVAGTGYRCSWAATAGTTAGRSRLRLDRGQ